MTFITGKPDYPTYEQIAGTPEEIIQGVKNFPDLPLETLWARCLNCWTVQAVGRYRYVDELVTLPDGSSTTADRWKREGQRAHYFRGVRVKVHCSECESLTDHIAEVR